MPELIPVEHDQFKMAVSAQNPVFDALTTGANIQSNRFTVPQQMTSEGYPYFQAGTAPSYPEAAPSAEGALALQPISPWGWHKDFETELSDPYVRNRLMAITNAEVGTQGPQAQQAFSLGRFPRARHLPSACRSGFGSLRSYEDRPGRWQKGHLAHDGGGDAALRHGHVRHERNLDHVRREY